MDVVLEWYMWRLVIYLHLNTSTPSTYTSFSTLIWQQQQSTSGFALLMGGNLAQMWHSRDCWAICDNFLSTQRKYLLHFFFYSVCNGIIIADAHWTVTVAPHGMDISGLWYKCIDGTSVSNVLLLFSVE